jgi:hypothetical protein
MEADRVGAAKPPHQTIAYAVLRVCCRVTSAPAFIASDLRLHDRYRQQPVTIQFTPVTTHICFSTVKQ